MPVVDDVPVAVGFVDIVPDAAVAEVSVDDVVVEAVLVVP